MKAPTFNLIKGTSEETQLEIRNSNDKQLEMIRLQSKTSKWQFLITVILMAVALIPVFNNSNERILIENQTEMKSSFHHLESDIKELKEENALLKKELKEIGSVETNP